VSEKFYITTAIDYVNGAPHIGHALEKIQADVLARAHRAHGNRVFFLTGTDEHGAKIARTAEMQKKAPQTLADENAALFRGFKEYLSISWDDFLRTTDQKKHWPAVAALWGRLVEKGDIYKKSYKGLYCVGHEAFVTEKDLVQGKCADHGKAPEAIEEENYFFKLSKYSKEIGERIRRDEFEIVPEGRKSEILALIEKEGLEDVSFSRPRKDLEWGIPVPGDDTQTIYVWADALANYLSAIGYPAESYKKFWPPDVQVIGKDILRFHAAIWPGILLSLGLPLPKKLCVHGFITAEGKKMSKTLGNVINPKVLVGKYGTDPVRYYLLREIPTTEDGDFSEEKFKERYNADLANGLGNFVARVLALAAKERKLERAHDVPKEVLAKIQEVRKEVAAKIDAFRLHEALAALWELIAFGDEYVNQKEPWKIEDAKLRGEVVCTLLSIVSEVGELLAPFLPGTAEKILASVEWDSGTDAIKINRGAVLFPRLE
jgi:methionyl-tRNA synthetase